MKKFGFLFLVFGLSVFLSGCTLDQTAKVEQVKKYPSGIFKSINGGESWDSKSFVSRNQNRIISISDSLVYDINFSPVNSTMVVSTRNNGLYFSNSYGENWSPLFSKGKDIKAFSFDSSSGSSYYVGYENSLYKTDNYGKDWKVVYTDPDSKIVYVRADYNNPSDVYVFLYDGRILKTEDRSSFRVIYDFLNRPKQDSNSLTDVKYSNDSVKAYGISKVYFYDKNISYFYVLTNDGNLYKTSDSGRSFDQITVPNTSTRFLTFYPGSYDSFILVTDDGIYKTFDAGDNFEKVQILTNKNKKVTALAISPADNNIIYYALGDLIYKTKNGGDSWNTVFSPVTRIISTLRIDASKPTDIYLGSDIDLRMVEQTNNKSILCDLFGILFVQLCQSNE